VSVTEQVRRARPRPEAAGGPRRATAGVDPRPLVAASIVLVMWFAWLLVPDPARRDLLGAPEPLPTWTGAALDDSSGADTAGADADDPQRAGDASGAEPDRQREAEADESDDPATELAEVAEAEEGADTASEAEPAAEAPVEVPQAGDGTFAVAPGASEPFGSGAEVRYSVEVETGVPLDPAQVAGIVDGVLADPRSWSGSGEWTLQRTDADPDVRILITSPDTTDALCAPLRTNGQVSCRNGENVVLNALRWTQGARSWGDDVVGYRQYLVNHELGHFLGFGHVGCPGEGEPAPVMLQQTLGLQGCAPNAWPNA
jgi:hypothetical protein